MTMPASALPTFEDLLREREHLLAANAELMALVESQQAKIAEEPGHLGHREGPHPGGHMLVGQKNRVLPIAEPFSHILPRLSALQEQCRVRMPHIVESDPEHHLGEAHFKN